MAKIRVKDGKKLLIVFICLALAFAIVFFGIPKIVEREEALTKVIRVKKAIEPNTEITEEMLSVVEVGKYNLSSKVITDKADIVGQYSREMIYPTDNLVKEKFQEEKEREDKFLYDLDADKLCVSITVPTLASALSGKLQEGDLVKVYVYKEDKGNNVDEEEKKAELIDFPELKYVEVVGITNSNTEDIEDVEKAIEEDKVQSSSGYSNHNNLPSTIIFKCYNEQAKKLVEAENLGIIHIAFVTRNDHEKVKFLEVQKNDLIAIYPEMEKKDERNTEEGSLDEEEGSDDEEEDLDSEQIKGEEVKEEDAQKDKVETEAVSKAATSKTTKKKVTVPRNNTATPKETTAVKGFNLN